MPNIAITLSTLRWVSNTDLRLLMDHMWLGVETFDKRKPAVAGVFYTIHRGLAREHARRRAMVDAILAATWDEADSKRPGGGNGAGDDMPDLPARRDTRTVGTVSPVRGGHLIGRLR